MVSLFTEEKGSATCIRIVFKEDEYLVLLLHAIVTLVNTCTIEQLEKISRHISESLLIYLKSLWAEIHKQMLLGNVLEFSLGRQYYLSKIRPNNLVESIFRLSINAGQLTKPSNHKEVKRSIFDLGEISFEYFMLNHWEVSPLLIRRPSKAVTNVFSSFEEILRPGDAFPYFLSPILKKCTSSLPISSDELDVLNFLEEERDHLGCPLIYQQDIRVLKTQYLNRELHFFPERSGSCFPQDPHFLYIDDILKCEEAYEKGYSIALRGMEFRFESIASIADGLASLFGQPSAGVNMYLTPPNSQGLARHYDDHCVLVCQLIGVKKWMVFPPSNLQLPHLYEPVDSLHDSDGGSMMVDGSTQVLLREGDVLYIPRGFPHEACTAIDIDGPDGNAGFSLHLTLAIEVEPPFEWEGFTHVALHHWGQNQYLTKYTSADTLSWNLNVLAVNLMHIAIKTSGDTDATFRKACLVGAILLPSVTEGWLDANQRTVFRHLLNTVNTQSRFVDVLRDVEVAMQNHEDPLQDIRWLQHLNREGEMIEGQNWNSPSIEAETFFHLVGHHLDKAEAAFMHAKSKFCSEVIFENVEYSYKMLLEKYRMARNQYMNGMLSLHCD